jgi:hypothetical protein
MTCQLFEGTVFGTNAGLALSKTCTAIRRFSDLLYMMPASDFDCLVKFANLLSVAIILDLDHYWGGVTGA